MQQGTGLTLDEVVRTALENHSSVKSAQYQVGAQDAVLHQQMAAYYPTISFSNTYRTANSGGSSSNASKGFDSFTGAGNASMTLYNFGKREGAVQSARDTLDATQYAYNTTANNNCVVHTEPLFLARRAWQSTHCACAARAHVRALHGHML